MAKQLAKSNSLKLIEVRSLFASLIRDQKLFLVAKSRLDSNSFAENQEGIKIIWEQLISLYSKYKKMPKVSQLRAAIIAFVDETDNDDEDMQDEVGEILDLAESFDRVDLASQRNENRRILRIFLDIAVARELRENLELQVKPTSLMRDAMNRIAVNKSVETGAFKNWFGSLESAVSEAKVRIFVTGQALVDELTNGGPRGGECLLHMGAINSGKTTLAVDVAVSRAFYEYFAAQKENRKPGVVSFYSYEESRQVFAQVLTRASNVSFNSIDKYMETQDISVLSSSKRKDYKGYERAWRKIGGKSFDGEEERLKKAFEILKVCFNFVAMSSEDPSNGELSGEYVDGLVQHYESYLAATKAKPDLIVIDHASAMVERYMFENGKGKDERRHLLKTLSMLLKDKLAAPYQVPIWCLHQLGSEENRRPPGTVPEPASGSECRMMHEFFSFALQSSRVTEPDKIGVVALGKKRRMKGADHIAFQIDGEFSRWKDARSTHAIQGGKVRSIEDAKRIVDSESVNSGTAAFTPRRRMVK
jgi:RecA/RadA recombinase